LHSRPVVAADHGHLYLCAYSIVDDAYRFDEMPWKRMFEQEFRLLSF
jgi:hypothetical protein